MVGTSIVSFKDTVSIRFYVDEQSVVQVQSERRSTLSDYEPDREAVGRYAGFYQKSCDQAAGHSGGTQEIEYR